VLRSVFKTRIPSPTSLGLPLWYSFCFATLRPLFSSVMALTLFRVAVAAVGLGVPLIRTYQELRPGFDPSTIVIDRTRLSVIENIMIRMGIPASVGIRLKVYVGEHNALSGGPLRFGPPFSSFLCCISPLLPALMLPHDLF